MSNPSSAWRGRYRRDHRDARGGRPAAAHPGRRVRPGTRLKIDDIAALCAVSHMPVRDALHMLEREGVLDVLPHRGAVIRPVDARSCATSTICARPSRAC